MGSGNPFKQPEHFRADGRLAGMPPAGQFQNLTEAGID